MLSRLETVYTLRGCRQGVGPAAYQKKSFCPRHDLRPWSRNARLQDMYIKSDLHHCYAPGVTLTLKWPKSPCKKSENELYNVCTLLCRGMSSLNKPVWKQMQLSGKLLQHITWCSCSPAFLFLAPFSPFSTKKREARVLTRINGKIFAPIRKS